MPYCFALSIGTPPSLSCVSGRAWNNISELHPKTCFFSPNLSIFIFIFFALYFVCFFFVCHFCFELNNFVLM